MAIVNLSVNGKAHKVEVEDDTPLLYALRDHLEINGPKFGCGLGQCGACTVIVDGQAIRSCVTPTTAMQSKSVTTLEGLGQANCNRPLSMSRLCSVATASTA